MSQYPPGHYSAGVPGAPGAPGVPGVPGVSGVPGVPAFSISATPVPGMPPGSSMPPGASSAGAGMPSFHTPGLPGGFPGFPTMPFPPGFPGSNPYAMPPGAAPIVSKPVVNTTQPPSNFSQPDPVEEHVEEAPVQVVQYSVLSDKNMRPATVDEQLRIIYFIVSPEAVDDFWLDRIIRSSGKITDWVRIKDSLGKSKGFGFVEYEDVTALGRGIKIISQALSGAHQEVKLEDGEEDDPDKPVFSFDVKYSEDTRRELESVSLGIDEGDKEYSSAVAATMELIKTWEDPDARKSFYENYLAEHPEAAHQDNDSETADLLRSTAHPDDEGLADMPPEQRATIMKEIGSFRNRANERERERIKKEEQVERTRLQKMQAEKEKTRQATSQTPKVTSLGFDEPIEFKRAKDRHIEGESTFIDDDDDEERDVYDDDGKALTDAEIEERRLESVEDKLETKFLDRERRYTRDERVRIANAERDTRRDVDDKDRLEKTRAMLLIRYSEWDDDREEERQKEEYYRDRSAWLRNRNVFRLREAEIDARETEQEEKSKKDESESRESAADVDTLVSSFLEQQASQVIGGQLKASEKKEELKRNSGPIRVSFKKEESSESVQKPISIGLSKPTSKPITKSSSGFKIGLGGKKSELAGRRPAALADDDDDDDDDGNGKKRRKLIPLSYDKLKEDRH
ncbi:uncharacterized protein V1516DRAFT_686913 [Lipomyces oligophaga]|uniref:uncharacterized protein n=1 Tax=Lipomyces oligophaga TaxID=45792 RepID=UPI0034CD708B